VFELPVARGQIAFALAAVVTLAAGCRENRESDTDKAARPIVAVTIFPIADLAREIAGPAADVVTVLPPGASPHTFEQSPDLARRLARARVVVAVGAGLDDWASDLARGSHVRRVAVTEGVALVDGNPHVWLDPILVRDGIVPRLVDALVAIAPTSADEIRARATRCRTDLTALDAEIRARLALVSSRAFVASHPAWTYFAVRYNLDEVGVVYRAEGREPSPRELAALVDRARLAKVRAVFTEPQLGELGVRALADELGATVETLDPLGGAGVAERGSYFELLRYDMRVFARALGDGDG
jgi:ABC-type Zn uptake system ZnuABC Zn-binding protein ZnuA